MSIATSFRILGILLMLFSCAMLPSLAFSLIDSDSTTTGFLDGFLITLLGGFLLWAPCAKARSELRIRDGFLVTSLFWIVLGIFGAAPFWLTPELNMTLTDAIFESISGLTTTGATVITGLDDLPRSILLYRQLLQWLGGIGIIVVAMAILPMLGVGGMALYRAETPGPSKDNKLTPRISGTALALFYVYIVLTLTCALAYYLAGMSAFDAFGHAFSTVAIGGFSTHDASMGYFKNDAILWISSLFMLISAINFGLHFFAWKHKSLSGYYRDPETGFYLVCIFVSVLITCVYLLTTQTLTNNEALVHGVFQAISMATTTGFTTTDFASWPTFLPVMLIFFSFIGGCVGSTGGGLKVMRVLLIFKQGLREMKQLVHPQAIIPLRVGGRRVDASIISAVWSFFAVYVSAFLVILLVLMATGLDYLTAFSAVAAMLNNLGPGLGEVASNYSSVSDETKWILCFTMLLGRLEVFTLLVLLTPMFWRH